MRGHSIRWRLLSSYILLTVLILSLLSVTFFHLYQDTLLSYQRQLMQRDGVYLIDHKVELQAGQIDTAMEDQAFSFIAQRYEGAIWLVDMEGAGTALDSVSGNRKALQLTQEQMENLHTNLTDDTRGEDLNFQGFFESAVVSEAEYIYDQAEGKPVGILVLHMRLHVMEERLFAVHRNAIMAGCMAIICSLVLMVLYARGIIRPLKQISNACRQVRRGDFTARARVERNDEIGQMAQSFNAMIARLDGVEQSRRKFIADVSHELRTPLTSMQGYLQGISDGVIPEAEREKYLDVVKTQVRHMSCLVEDLLQMSQFTAGQIKLQCCKVDLCELICRVLIRFERQIMEKQLSLQTDFERDSYYVYADPMRMEQVFGNLLDNAIKFTPQGGEIRVYVQSVSGGLAAGVQDSGMGMTEEECEFVFDRFYKSDGARTPGGGYGLGLSISYQIVQLHKANIEVKSQVGKGSTFIVTFPNDLLM